MVDPASSGSSRSQQSHQQQPASQQQQPASSLSITVTPLTEHVTNHLEEGSNDFIGPISQEMLVEASKIVFDDIVDDVILGIVFQVHRSIKLGLTALLEDGLTGDSQSQEFESTDDTTRSSGGISAVAEEENAEIFSTMAALAKKPVECVCPNCQRNMAASRFAPHLEKCMGMGRNSSRLASRRIATTATREAQILSDEDVEEDSEWLGGNGSAATSDKKRRHHKKDKNSPRRKKWKNGPDSINGSSISGLALASNFAAPAGSGSSGGSGSAENSVQGDVPSGMETIPMTERRTLLLTMCGVVSEHTGRMCTRSLRCPQHSDVQRKGVREVMMAAENDDNALSTLTSDVIDKDKEIDVDTWEEGDSLASLLTAQVQSQDVTTPMAEASPAESTCTSTSSTSSTRREGKGKSQKNKKEQH